jgi:predicted membrane chloride channel (bestrophin family)
MDYRLHTLRRTGIMSQLLGLGKGSFCFIMPFKLIESIVFSRPDVHGLIAKDLSRHRIAFLIHPDEA